MNAVERLSSYISRGVYTVSGPFHPFGGAVDIIVVEQPDGSFKSSPWYVKFGKFQGVLKTREKVVSVSVNGTEAGFHMYLDHKGEAYFLREVDGNECGSVFSPPSSGDETVEWAQKERSMNSQGIDFDGNQLNSVTQIDASNGKIVSRTNSRRSRIFGLVFGRKSMKEDGRCKKGEIDMQRINSLERAEIAADLLEVRWSTNLPTSGRTADTASPLTAPEVPTEETSKDVQVSDKQEPSRPSMHDSMNCSATDVDVENSCLQTHEQILQTIRDVENVHLDEPTVVPLQGPSFAESEADPVGYSSDFKKSNTNEESDRDDGHLTKNVSKENCERGVSTNMYSDTSISLRSGTNASGEGGLEILSFSDGGGEEVEVYTKVLYNTNEFISVMNSKLEPDVHMGKESLDKFDDSIQLSRGENSSESRNAENEGKMAPEKPIEKSSVFQSSSIDGEPLISETFSSLDIELLGLDSIESEEVEIIHQEAVVEKFNPEKTLKMKMSEISENQSRVTDTSSSLLGSTNGAGEERTPSAPDSCIGSVAVYQIPGSFKEGESNAASCSSHISKSMNQAQESENLGDTGDTHALHLSSVVYVNAKEDNSESLPEEVINSGMPPPNSLDEDQLLFRESDDFVVDCIRHEESTFADASKTDNQETQSTEEDHESNGVHHVSPLPSNQSLESQSFPIVGSYSPDLTQDLLPNAFEDWLEESQARSSPISIPKRHRFEGEAGHLVGSLPNMRDHIQDLEKSNVCKPLSRSLDLRTESSNWGTLREDLSSSLKLKLDTESNTVQDHPMAAAADALVNTQKMGEDEQMSSNPAVEISLCRHLLFDGMGLDAASRAFDGEKMDFKKFSDLGPLVVKNDKLVVRIGGRYFPWDVAAPIILGMVSFGLEPIFEPEGMIAVDQAERTLEGELSRAAIPSGGSWRLWPFHFRRSETERSVHPAPEGTKGKGAEVDNNASESAREVTGDNKMNKPKTPKKKAMQSRVPTSEQLASLDLKEGQNLITFTFSTAMLGRQQVDARIYLWKWNTRIVISDVDGTITKSDVLGQFMPLVGRDWSQSGVAHLFSSIKENGYQFLFLSARAISQAYLTRQFLFNLKQDGKALPDGPVLISPDGLFPSLYREVIRRAPHEFKIACLQVIRALFPPDCNPFYAGFGNRDTDEVSYLKVGIPKGKIFIINPKGEVAVNRRVDTKSYTSLHSLVHGMFPATSSAEQSSSRHALKGILQARACAKSPDAS